MLEANHLSSTHGCLGWKTKSTHGAPLSGGVPPHRYSIRRVLRLGHDECDAPHVETIGMAGLRRRIRGSHCLRTLSPAEFASHYTDLCQHRLHPCLRRSRRGGGPPRVHSPLVLPAFKRQFTL